MSEVDLKEIAGTIAGAVMLVLLLLGGAVAVTILVENVVLIALLGVAAGVVGVLVYYPEFRQIYVWTTSIVVHVGLLLAVMFSPFVSTEMAGSVVTGTVVGFIVLTLAWFGFNAVLTGDGR